MSITALTLTTLTNQIDKSQTKFALGATTSIYGLGSLTNPQSIIVIDNEAMLVLNIPASGWVEVTRGVNGSRAVPHPAAANVYAGSKTQFGAQEDGHVGLAGDAGNPAGFLPNYRLPLGSRVRYAGKEYILCDFLNTVHSGVVVAISGDGLFTATTSITGQNGSVGVVAEQTSSSDQWGWVQIYGYCLAQEASNTSGITSAYVPIIASSVSTPATILSALVNTTSTPQKLIMNMFITGDASTATTGGVAAGSHTGSALPVFLNYPYALPVASDVGLS